MSVAASEVCVCVRLRQAHSRLAFPPQLAHGDCKGVRYIRQREGAGACVQQDAALPDDRHALDGNVFQQEKRACDISCTSIPLRLSIRGGSLFIG